MLKRLMVRPIPWEVGDPCPHCGVKHRAFTPVDCADRAMPERTLQDRVVDRAHRRGWTTAHAGKGIAAFTKDGKPIFVTPMAKGWPDLTLAKEGHRLIFMELKKQLEEPTPEQIDWLYLLNRCGARAIVVRPSDLRRINAVLDQGSPL